jgi:PGF-pre-PGF domain-containing protein
MRIKAIAGFIALLLLIFLMPASAMTFGEARAGSTFVVSGLPPNASVQFILNHGVPVFDVADANGKASYLPLLQGSLDIVVMQGGSVVDSASTTVLAPITPSGGQSGGGGPSTGGGGSGGGGVTTSEPFDNILMYLRIDGNLIANTSVSYNFSSMPQLGIYEILVTGSENENAVSMRVELLKGTSKLVTASPPGNVYKNVNIWAGSKRIIEGRIRFKVDNTWISGSGGVSGDVKLLKWDGSKWVQLETTQINNDADSTYYEAKTETFSPYAISGMGGVVTPTATPVVTGGTPVQTPLVTPIPAVKPGTPWAYIIVLVVIIAVVAYLYTATRKKEKK